MRSAHSHQQRLRERRECETRSWRQDIKRGPEPEFQAKGRGVGNPNSSPRWHLDGSGSKDGGPVWSSDDADDERRGASTGCLAAHGVGAAWPQGHQRADRQCQKGADESDTDNSMEKMCSHGVTSLSGCSLKHSTMLHQLEQGKPQMCYSHRGRGEWFSQRLTGRFLTLHCKPRTRQ